MNKKHCSSHLGEAEVDGGTLIPIYNSRKFRWICKKCKEERIISMLKKIGENRDSDIRPRQLLG